MTYVIPPATAIGVVQLRVSQLDRSIRFYEEAVGLRLVRREGGAAELAAAQDGSDRVLLRLRELHTDAAGNAASATPPGRRPGAGLYHFAILVPDRRSLGLALRNLIRHGVSIGQADHLVSEALYISDPDQNGIEIYADRPRETWRRDANGEYVMAVDPIDWDGLLADAGDLPGNGLPVGTTIGHIHLHVSDLAATERFYNGVLGFEIVAHMQRSALFISAGGYHHHIGLNVWAGVGAPLTPAYAPGLDYYTIVVPNAGADADTLSTLQSRLEAAGFKPTRDAATSGAPLIVHDPSGIELWFIAA
ncbi:VOC family protein [Paenibacillus koleovorans]|uniref:VOC family protein n=1 Tax=Paenibacillus koleovorans TaxID=121608 RepID=UPI000FD9D56D|nr:VOC family protein [Paenibacillus koleovorans]